MIIQKRPVLLIILFYYSYMGVMGQNIVVNPNFEDYYYCPPVIGVDSFPAKYWKAANICTPDYYNSCSTDKDFGVPDNWNGHYQAKNGNAYIGLIILADKDGSTEHITGILKYPLKKDSIYWVSFYVRFAQYVSDYSAKGIGVYLSKVNPFSNSLDPDSYLLLTPTYRAQVLYKDYLTDTSWIKVEGKYTAQGGEKYITLGLFWNDDDKLSHLVNKLNQSYSWNLRSSLIARLNKTTLMPNKFMNLSTGKDNSKIAYYLFDEISVVPTKQ